MTELQEHSKIERYDSLDGLRACAAIGIIAMHILLNGPYHFDGFLFNKLIPSFAKFVFLFMMMSSFSMCCGYYDKIIDCKISLEKFYFKRYAKIWPFFAFLTVTDIVISPSSQSIMEAFANLTLCFGLLPNARISVIGVGWTLGVTFVFYLLFPFFCFLISKTGRAWLAFVVSIILQRMCCLYFFDTAHVVEDFSGKTNILYCAIFFLTGGLIYRYREKLIKLFGLRFRWVLLLIALACGCLSFCLEETNIVMVIMFAAVLIYCICAETKKGFLNNRAMRFLSNIS